MTSSLSTVCSLLLVMIIGRTGYAQTTTELLHFRSEVQGTTVAFDWSVIESSNIQAFGLERAGRDLRFETVGTVAVRPTHQASATYRFTDQHPLDGVAFYRLKITDHAGNVQYCKVVSQATTASAG